MNNNTYCIIMAGGFGSRFWPMSKENCPKQFLDILGQGQSMLQSTFKRFEKVCPRENIIIVTGEVYEERVRQQIPDLRDYQVICEPTRRNTAPCIAYAAAVINSICPAANIIVTPSDHAIFGEDRFVQDLEQALDVVEHHDWIVTVGVQPTTPTTKYGYIQYADMPSLPTANNIHSVVTFTEKPPLEMARQFLASGEFFWNAGIFVWRLSVLMDAYRRHLPSIAESFFQLGAKSNPQLVEEVYSVSESISVDFGIMEKADNVHVMEASFGWSDVETWDSLYSTCHKDNDGNVFVNGNIFAYDVKNCVVNVPAYGTVVLQGLDGYIVTGNDKIVMICRRDQEERVVKFASDVELRELTSKK